MIAGAAGGGRGAYSARSGWAASSFLSAVGGGVTDFVVRAGTGETMSMKDMGISLAAGVSAGNPAGTSSSSIMRRPPGG